MKACPEVKNAVKLSVCTFLFSNCCRLLSAVVYCMIVCLWPKFNETRNPKRKKFLTALEWPLLSCTTTLASLCFDQHVRAATSPTLRRTQDHSIWGGGIWSNDGVLTNRHSLPTVQGTSCCIANIQKIWSLPLGGPCWVDARIGDPCITLLWPTRTRTASRLS